MIANITLPELQVAPSIPSPPEVPVWRRALDEIWADRKARGYQRLTAEEIEAWVAEAHDPESEPI